MRSRIPPIKQSSSRDAKSDYSPAQLFPGGVEVRSEGGLDKAIRATRELVANREVPAIFEGTFEHGGVLVRVDVLHRRKDESLAIDRSQIHDRG